MGSLPEYSQALPERSTCTFQRVVQEISRLTDYRFLCRLRDAMTDVLRVGSDESLAAKRKQQVYELVHDVLTDALYQKERHLIVLKMVERENEVLYCRHALVRGSLRHILRNLHRWMGPKCNSIADPVRSACRMIFLATEARLDQIRPEGDPRAEWNIYVKERKTG